MRPHRQHFSETVKLWVSLPVILHFTEDASAHEENVPTLTQLLSDPQMGSYSSGNNVALAELEQLINSQRLLHTLIRTLVQVSLPLAQARVFEDKENNVRTLSPF